MGADCHQVVFDLVQVGHPTRRGKRRPLAGAKRTGEGLSRDFGDPLGLIVAALSALATDIGFLMRHKGVQDAPEVDIRKPKRTVVGLFTKKWWCIGFAFAFLAWGAARHLDEDGAALARSGGARQRVVLLGSRRALLRHRSASASGSGITAHRRPASTFLGITSAEAKLEGAETPSTRCRRHDRFRGRPGRRCGVASCSPLATTARGPARSSARRGRRPAVLRHSRQPSRRSAESSSYCGLTSSTLLRPGPTCFVIAGGVWAFFISARSLQLGKPCPVVAVTSAASNA